MIPAPERLGLECETGKLDPMRNLSKLKVCFLAGTRHSSFLERHGGIGQRPGKILDLEGETLGEHRGAHIFTVGQRHGLGIGAPAPYYYSPFYAPYYYPPYYYPW